ncbi:MAG TPA: T9SS type A sorting domain-containing protein, partial [Chitinophagales bacterium]|nr:T9SS type A sorting domain-containing protein [Chitinophagales bacterium]
GNPATSTDANPTVMFSTVGTHSVTLVATNCVGSDTVITASAVTVYANPTETTSSTNASSASATDGSATVAASGGTSPYSYLWSNSGTTATISGVAAGLYHVTVTDAHGCSSSDTVTVSFNVGIAQLGADKEAKIYPNPATDVMYIQWNTNVDAEISIIDLTGKVVKAFESNNQLLNSLDIHALATGTYVLRITDKATREQQSVKFSKF